MDSFTESPEGFLYVANGFDPMLRWDGLTAQMELAGLTAPTTAPTMAASTPWSLGGPTSSAGSASIHRPVRSSPSVDRSASTGRS